MVLTPDETFLFDLQFLAKCPKLWQLKHCLTETGDRNSSTMSVIWQTRFWEMSASASVGSLISIQNNERTLLSFLLFKRSAFAYDILFRSRNSLNSLSVISVGTP